MTYVLSLELRVLLYQATDFELGQRVTKETGGTTTHFYYNAAWQVLETREGAGEPENLQPKVQYVWSLRYIDAPVLRDENTDEDDLCDDETLYYLTDANMNVTCLVNTGGVAVERYLYDPYGKVTILNGANNVDKDGAVTEWTEDGDQTASDVDNAILYCGYYHDCETGLYHVRRRTLHPYFGWLQRDPIGYADGMSLYEYVGSSPVLGGDAFGLARCLFGYRLPCWALAKVICTTQLDDKEGKRAWDRYVSRTGGGINLSNEEMADLRDVSENTQNFLDNLELLCNSGAKWPWQTDSIPENYGRATRWDEAIGHADLQVATRCQSCCLYYTVYLHDLFDFTPRLIEKRFNPEKKYNRGWVPEGKVWGVWLAKIVCGWEPSFHSGKIAGEQGTGCD